MAAPITNVPKGCGLSVGSLYFNLCDLTAVWGIVVESLAALGVVTAFVLIIILMASLPFVTDRKRKGMVALQASFLAFTLGLFGLSFAFIMGRDFTSCTARRFLFGVLFAGGLACLLMHGLWLVLLNRQGQGPQGWMLCLGALAFWLVEIIINTEWLIITVERRPMTASGSPDISCSITNQDFVMALIYVMALLLGVVLMAVPSLTHKHKAWRRDGAFILATGVCSMAVWVAWIVMYIHGNQVAGDPSWDDPTLAIALVSNAWVFLVLYTIPEICSLTKEQEEGDEQPSDGEHIIYPVRSLVYDNILKEQNTAAAAAHQNMYMENKAFSMDEPNTAANKPVSPYGGYSGQLRSCVYQPTELALITKSLANRDQSHETGLPRATAPTLNQSSTSLPHSLVPLPTTGLSPAVSGNGVYKKPLW
uniref:G-protein coupled receptor family C group 5 member C-like isoform X1 n=1 Tax=Oncorhynchus gorbuscha TaxID=8017 RepID=UPI001EAED9E5|nr:G-protein coupled receptor family C group 5 member C-like isoform X1 [Oncorhynchus gorbuscha]XP_046162479.1 G-protein coupled receptor family C group 5 member C-like isoform X1 [Oncorhynchus gorbuscha]